MLEILEQFRVKGRLDELRFSSTRDSIADLLFPGMSAIRTRARCLLSVPSYAVRWRIRANRSLTDDVCRAKVKTS